jgi:hypothetical protein
MILNFLYFNLKEYGYPELHAASSAGDVRLLTEMIDQKPLQRFDMCFCPSWFYVGAPSHHIAARYL